MPESTQVPPRKGPWLEVSELALGLPAYDEFDDRILSPTLRTIGGSDHDAASEINERMSQYLDDQCNIAGCSHVVMA